MWQHGYCVSSYSSSRSRNQSNSTPVQFKSTKFKITLFSAVGTMINSWIGTGIRHENGVCKFYNEETGTLVQIVGIIVIE